MATISEMRVRGNVREIMDKRARQDLDDANKSIREHDSMQQANAWGYFYKRGFFNSSLVFDESNRDVVTLKIPMENPSFVILSCESNFQDSTISGGYLFTYELTDGTITRSGSNAFHCMRAGKTDGNYLAVARSIPNSRYVYILVGSQYVDSITVIRNDPLEASGDRYKKEGAIETLTAENTANELCFMSESYISLLTASGRDVTCLWKIVKAGDKLSNLQTISGLVYKGSYHAADGSVDVRINGSSYTCAKDGIVCLFDLAQHPTNIKYTPAKRIRLTADDIEGLDITVNNPYDGLNGVAFGTSLTYRAQTTGGYLNYLPALSGITFDNQGVGSATIKRHGDTPCIMDKITDYTGYANKSVCILEGFVNDWGYNYDQLGTWDSTSTETVCGCVRAAINHIMAQNQNITIFLVLDHYGKNYSDTDTSSTALNGNNQTQFEWWEEVAKVGRSMGIPVIMQYAESGIGENTPQYLMDNIHPTALGAEQSARVIWAAMRQHYPNKTL